MSDSDDVDEKFRQRKLTGSQNEEEEGDWLGNLRKNTKKPTARNIESDYDRVEEFEASKKEEESSLPLKCIICNEPFLDPIVTNCKHYFCQTCAQKHHEEKNGRCFVCDEPTLGVFNTAVRIKKRIAQEREKAIAMVKEVSETMAKASKMVNEAGALAEKAIRMATEAETLVKNARETATKAEETATDAIIAVEEAKTTVETAKSEMAKAFAVMKNVKWDK